LKDSRNALTFFHKQLIRSSWWWCWRVWRVLECTTGARSLFGCWREKIEERHVSKLVLCAFCETTPRHSHKSFMYSFCWSCMMCFHHHSV
jgi:hypothetical protein